LDTWTRVRQFRGRRVPFSSFARPDSFSAVPRASGAVLMLCAPGLIFGGTEGVRYCYHGLRARTRFRRLRGLRVAFSCFALPNSFSAVLRASGPVLMFCAPRLVFDGSEGFGSRFNVLRAQTCFADKDGFGSRFQVLCSRNHFQRSRVRWVPFSCFARPD
jgi:hypothetical protein